MLVAALGVLLLTVLGVGAWWFLLRNDGGGAGDGAGTPAVATDDPRSVAEGFAVLLQRAEDEGEAAVRPDSLAPLVCAADMPQIEQSYAEHQAAGPSDPALRYTYSVSEVRTEGDAGTVTFERRHRDTGEVEQQGATLVRENGDWQVCGLSDATAGDQGEQDEPTAPPSTTR
ncbi:MAG TPA: hypothetical protein VGD67_01895 [Pseudonocardiaceae bacterium]